MNSKVMQILNNPSASLSRNGFDRSKRDIFSCKSGVLNLVACIDCVPNSHYEINPVLFTRTNAFNEANFVRMRQELNFYFVPYSSMFTPFNEFLEQTSDPKSAIYQSFANHRLCFHHLEFATHSNCLMNHHLLKANQSE